MNYRPLVSIIIPLYNGSNYVGQAIECAINQTYKNIEIIVVNDGSRDDGAGAAVAQRYSDKIKYFHKENGGVSSALNFALSKMQGEWFSWLSHDDLYAADKIEKQVAYISAIMQNEKDVDLSRIFVHCNAELMDANGITVYKRNLPYTGKIKNIDVILCNLRRNGLGGCSFLLPKSCFETVGGFSENIRTISDFDYWYRMLFAGYQFYQMDEFLVKYRVHGAQVTYKMSDLGEKETNDFYIWCADEIMKNKEYNSFDHIFTVACCALEKGYKTAAQTVFDYAKQMDINKYNFGIITKVPIYYLRGIVRRAMRKAFVMIKIK